MVALNNALRGKQSLTEEKGQRIMRFWVENSGNNFQLIKHLLKRRLWMQPVDGGYHYQYNPPASQLEQIDVIMTQVKKRRIIEELLPFQVYNHIEGISAISNKGLLHKNMTEFYKNKGLDPCQYLPESYVITQKR